MWDVILRGSWVFDPKVYQSGCQSCFLPSVCCIIRDHICDNEYFYLMITLATAETSSYQLPKAHRQAPIRQTPPPTHPEYEICRLMIRLIWSSGNFGVAFFS